MAWNVSYKYSMEQHIQFSKTSMEEDTFKLYFHGRFCESNVYAYTYAGSRTLFVWCLYYRKLVYLIELDTLIASQV